MNIIEKRKDQLKFAGILILVIGLVLALTGLILLFNLKDGNNINILKLVFGIILLILGIAGLGLGISITWISCSVKATHGSIAEDNLGKGTVNMNKCENCGAEVEPGVKICSKCEENLKP